MQVTVKLFASFREASGVPQSLRGVQPGATISSLWDEIVGEYPRLRPLSRTAAFALNGRYAKGDAALNDGDTVAFLPPVSGG